MKNRDGNLNYGKTWGRDIKAALKQIGSKYVFRVSQMDGATRKRKVSGLHWWISGNVLTFEDAEDNQAQVALRGACDYQECGFLHNTSLMALRQFSADSMIHISIENGLLIFTEIFERMILKSSFAIFEPVVQGGMVTLVN